MAKSPGALIRTTTTLFASKSEKATVLRSGWTDSVGVERAEMGDVARYRIYQDISVEYKFMIEPGAKNTAKWVVMGQLHSAMNMTPPVEIKFNGNDKMEISGKSGSTSNTVYRDIYTIAKTSFAATGTR